MWSGIRENRRVGAVLLGKPKREVAGIGKGQGEGVTRGTRKRKLYGEGPLRGLASRGQLVAL